MALVSKRQLKIAGFFVLLFSVSIVTMFAVRYRKPSNDAAFLLTGQLSKSDLRACARFRDKAGLDRRKEGNRVVQVFIRGTPGWYPKHITNAVAFSELEVVKLIGEPDQRGSVTQPSYIEYTTRRGKSGKDVITFYFMNGFLRSCNEGQVQF